MNKISIHKILSFATMLLLCLPMFAQNDIEMADQFRAEGKIYVVVGVVFIVLLGLFGYLFVTDKKLKQLEKEVYQNKN